MYYLTSPSYSQVSSGAAGWSMQLSNSGAMVCVFSKGNQAVTTLPDGGEYRTFSVEGWRVVSSLRIAGVLYVPAVNIKDLQAGEFSFDPYSETVTVRLILDS